MMRLQRQIEDFADYLEKLAPRSVRLIEKLAVPGLHYSGPGYEGQGTDGFEARITSLLADHPGLQIRVLARAAASDGERAFVRWTRIGSGRHIDGVTELLYGHEDMIIGLQDFWAPPMIETAKRTSWLNRFRRQA